MKHPEAPMFPLKREYRISYLQTAVFDRRLYCIQYKTWITRRWKSCSDAYPSLQAAQEELKDIKNGLPDWTPHELAP